MEEFKPTARIIALEHAVRTVFLMSCAALKYNGDQTMSLLNGLTEKLRTETFPTDDPALSMFAADEIADEFFDLLEPSLVSLALLDHVRKAQEQQSSSPE